MKENKRSLKRETRQAVYLEMVEDLLREPAVQKMAQFSHHGSISCLEHCLFVSYISFCLARFFRCDARSAARGGLLHDLFLYDWHDRYGHCRPHLFHHAKVACRNASKICRLSETEKDCILNHMWPFGGKVPKSRESVIVNFSDDICAIAEVMQIYRFVPVRKRIFAYGL